MVEVVGARAILQSSWPTRYSRASPDRDTAFDNLDTTRSVSNAPLRRPRSVQLVRVGPTEHRPPFDSTCVDTTLVEDPCDPWRTTTSKSNERPFRDDTTAVIRGAVLGALSTLTAPTIVCATSTTPNTPAKRRADDTPTPASVTGPSHGMIDVVSPLTGRSNDCQLRERVARRATRCRSACNENGRANDSDAPARTRSSRSTGRTRPSAAGAGRRLPRTSRGAHRPSP